MTTDGETLPTRATGVLRSTRMDDYVVKRHATEADLDLVPDHQVGEIIDGTLYAFPRPASLHARGTMRLARALGPADDDEGPDGWILLMEPAIWFGRKHMLIPDLAGWRRSRLPELPDVRSFKLAPDWVCEGLSPSTARYDRGRKREIYAAAGVHDLWIFDPQLKTLETFVLDGKTYAVGPSGGADDVRAFAPFDFKIDLARLWKR